MTLDNKQKAFLTLVLGGLWETEVQLAQYGDINFQEVYRLAEEQSIIGLVTAGAEHVVDVIIPQEETLTLVGATLQLEQRNMLMNVYLAGLIEKLQANDIYTLLVKGQGIAQCYERPLWRTCGDIDLLLSNKNYTNAFRLLITLSSNSTEESIYNKHVAFTINSWTVELHGTMRTCLWDSLDRAIDDVQNEVFCAGTVRSWVNGQTQIYIPRADEDVIFVFTHILQHFFREGIGLRQICDWCRLLWTYRDELNLGLLESRLLKMGIMTEWKAFAYLAVNYLGMDATSMPLYSADNKWEKKSKLILNFILETGNFGCNRDYSYYNHSYIAFKIISLVKHLKDSFRYFFIFPVDSLRSTERRIRVGLLLALTGKKHE